MSNQFSPDQIASQIFSNQMGSNQETSNKEIKTDVLKVRGRTLIFENSIYYISNISALEVVNLSTVRIMPRYYWGMLAAGLLSLVFSYSFEQGCFFVVGLFLCGIAGYLIYNFLQNALVEAYGLNIILNSGTSTCLIGKDREFLVKIALTLHNIMNDEKLSAFNFNLDQRQITEIKGVSGSTVVTGSVSGNIAHNV